MAILNQTFSASQLPASSSFDPLPPGWYEATITESSVNTTKAGTGQYIKIKYEITGPTHQGRTVYGNINISNPSAKAEEIGHQQLGELLRAANIDVLSDTDQLIGVNAQIKLKIRKSEEFGDSNEVQGFKAIEGGAPIQPQAHRAPEVATASKGTPWAK